MEEEVTRERGDCVPLSDLGVERVIRFGEVDIKVPNSGFRPSGLPTYCSTELSAGVLLTS